MRGHWVILILCGLGCGDADGSSDDRPGQPAETCDDGSAPPCSAEANDGAQGADDPTAPPASAAGEEDASRGGAGARAPTDPATPEQPEMAADDPEEPEEPIGAHPAPPPLMPVEYETLPSFEELCERDGAVAVGLSPAAEGMPEDHHFLVLTEKDFEAARTAPAGGSAGVRTEAGDHWHLADLTADAVSALAEAGSRSLGTGGYPPSADGAHMHRMQIQLCP